MNQRSEALMCSLFFVVGGITGAGAALLFAPRPGREVRGRLGRRLRRTAGSARELTERAIRRAERAATDAARGVEGSEPAASGNGGRTPTLSETIPPAPSIT